MSILSKLFGSDRKNRIQALIENGAVIIDVRSQSEFSSGHFKGSRNIPLQEIGSHVPKIKSENKPVVVCCASGMRSAQAKSILEKAGIEVENAGGWRALEN
ncbi:rhodanese-like domain-containing protein [Crocinitomix sp.]|nr:rhodanese-like domain-containing protein [Crocinitomix sp.]